MSELNVCVFVIEWTFCIDVRALINPALVASLWSDKFPASGVALIVYGNTVHVVIRNAYDHLINGLLTVSVSPQLC